MPVFPTLTRCAVCLLLASCATHTPTVSPLHLQHEGSAPSLSPSIPPVVANRIILPPPKPASTVATYSVVVANVSAAEILFALARDAKVNLDIHAGIQGWVTINAINQTLPQILARISKQVDMRYEISNGTLTVMPDSPYLRHYKIDYVNMTRDSESTVVTSAQVTATPNGTGNSNNNSAITIKDSSKNRFWETLVQNIKDILHETDKILPEGSSETTVQQSKAGSSTGTGAPLPTGNKRAAPKIGLENSPNPVSIEEGDITVTKRNTFREAASVIANPETGLIAVRATDKQHEKIQNFVDQVMSNARRQVMIEATIVEVRLSDNYQQGINWSSLIKSGGNTFKIVQSSAGLPTAVGNGILGVISNPTANSIAQQVSLLESFGDVRVLSSPKVSVMNNQTALIKVVDNLVYFIVGATTTSNQTGFTTTFTSEPKTLPVGFTMSVTPQISDADSVLFNLKPSISRITTFVNDPNPDLAKAGVVSKIPQTQTREMESVLRIENNQIGVMGGLMQDSINNLTDAVPLLSSIPFFGGLFKQRNDTSSKSELVIFLHPVVIKNADLSGDYHTLSEHLPTARFFTETTRTTPP
jgi:general secretion pathway protein D